MEDVSSDELLLSRGKVSSGSAHRFTPNVFESPLATFWLAIKCTHRSGNLDTSFPIMIYCMEKMKYRKVLGCSPQGGSE